MLPVMKTRIRDAYNIVPLAYIMFETTFLYFTFVLFFDIRKSSVIKVV